MITLTPALQIQINVVAFDLNYNNLTCQINFRLLFFHYKVVVFPKLNHFNLFSDMMGRFMEENESFFSSRSVSPSSNDIETNHVQDVKKELDYNTEAINENASINSENYNSTTKTTERNIDKRINSTTSDESWRSSTVTTSIPIGTTN